ncbi:MAG: DUF4384 domain-containing protein [Acidobacteria bacterium]|nr:DUF4384 domain-containing protein [Acidobacteriota bacterium]MCI0626670.1 DUF4384 domain-containing protein [Acidobacteriota bacterium]MCI0722491.1 DUF4384 domain-containing protein [Acidobacteriota bacterium]
MRLRIAAALLCLCQLSVIPSGAQTQSLVQGLNRIELQIERRENGNWKGVDPGLVFLPDDRVRFKVKTNFGGYLYVLNHGTSGEYTLLFPSADTGQQNRIEPKKDYAVPATEGSFRITGPAGHEVVYWLLSPVALEPDDVTSEYVPLPPPPKEKKAPPKLIPRCDETIFRARGDCVDTSAGPQRVVDEETLPDNLAGVPALSSRELTFIREENSSLVSVPQASTKPVIFEFRLAHR